jgi:gluconate 2-dehydrogenase alpha chain
MGAGALGTMIDDWNGDNFDHAGLGFVGGGLVGAYSFGSRPIASLSVPPGTPRWGSGWKKTVARYYDRNFSISCDGACQSYRGNSLDLDPTYRDVYGDPLLRMTFDFHENEYRMSDYLTERALAIAARIPGARADVHRLTGPYEIVSYQTTHNTGGAVMGADPGTSVVNRYLQSWDVPNLFVVGASAFPQNAGYNPSGTVGALTFWCAEAIKERYLKRPGPLA